MVTVFSPRWSPACLFLGYSYRNYSQFHTAKLLCSHKQKTAVGIKRFKNVCVYAGGRKVHARWFLIAGSCVFTKFETLSLLPYPSSILLPQWQCHSSLTSWHSSCFCAIMLWPLPRLSYRNGNVADTGRQRTWHQRRSSLYNYDTIGYRLSHRCLYIWKQTMVSFDSVGGKKGW